MQTKKDREIDDFLRSSSQCMKIEVIFIRDKFLRLSIEEQREIYNQLKSNNEDLFQLASEKLIKFVQDNGKEISESISKDFPPWNIPEYALEQKTRYVGLYFKMHLQEGVDEFTIEKIV